MLTLAGTLLLMTRTLGAAAYGAYASAASIAILAGIIPGAGAGYVLLSRMEQDETSPADVWSYALPTIVVLGILLTPPFVLLAVVCGGSSHLSPWQLAALGLNELLPMPSIVMLSFIIQARGRVILSQVTQWLPFALRAFAAAITLLVPASSKVTVFLCLQLGSSLLCACIAWHLANKLASLHWRIRCPKRSELRKGASYGLMNLIALNPAELDKVITLHLLGARETGIYAAASRVVNAMVTPVIALLLTVQVRLFGRGNESVSSRRHTVLQVAGASIAWGVISLLLLETSRNLLSRIFGNGFEQLADIMLWLAPVAPLLALRISAGTILVSSGKAVQRIAFELGGTLALCLSMTWLVPRHGLEGAAIALVIAESSMAIGGWLMIGISYYSPRVSSSKHDS